MNKRIVSFLLGVGLLIGCMAGYAEPFWGLSEVNVHRVQMIDSRLVGTIHLPDSVTNVVLRIDCDVPKAFTLDQQAVLQVEYRNISKSTLLDELADTAEDNREEQLRNWRISAERDGRAPNEKLAYGRACYELRGLPVADSVTWQEKGTPSLAPTVASCAMREDGTAAPLDIHSVPQILSETPMEIPPMEWQTWLEYWVANCYPPSTGAQDDPYEDNGLETGKIYASYDVITSIQPCWVGTRKNELEPGWMVEIENRIVKDDSLIMTRGSENALSTFVEGVKVK